MIDVKIIKKPKNEGTSSAIKTRSGAYEEKSVKEAAHAAKADLAEKAEQAEHADRSEYASRSGYADIAGDIAAGSPLLQKFLSKQEDDAAEGHITFKNGLRSLKKARLENGVEFGREYVPGVTGQGGQIDETGSAELRSLRLRESLEVPELRYNRVSIYTGIRWDTFGGGIIESVADGHCTLKLEDGEVGAIKEGDFCMGIWHNETGGNSTTDEDSRTGNFTFRGFQTIYFRIDEIPATDAEGRDNNDNHYFRYQLRDGYSMHPAAGMHFACRGNVSDTDRQSFIYTTTQYSLMLTGVNTWEWDYTNIIAITGKLDGFSMQTDSGAIKHFSGYGQVFGNAYMYGHIDQFDRAAERIEWATDNGEAIAEGEQTTVTLRAIKGFDEVQATWRVKSENGSITTSENPFTVQYSDLNSQAVTTLFEVQATLVTGAKINTIIPIKRLVNGKDAISVVIHTDRGTTMINGQGETTLTAVVTKGGMDITDTIAPSCFSWLRETGNTDYDAAWNHRHANVGKSITVKAEDVWRHAQFTCEVNIN